MSVEVEEPRKTKKTRQQKPLVEECGSEPESSPRLTTGFRTSLDVQKYHTGNTQVNEHVPLGFTRGHI